MLPPSKTQAIIPFVSSTQATLSAPPPHHFQASQDPTVGTLLLPCPPPERILKHILFLHRLSCFQGGLWGLLAILGMEYTLSPSPVDTSPSA